ncbi:hypothetical protein SCHPADRAFT_623724 [Schizopora paradoxa]|uniref:Uncharacterized protein n=1 Tax=Schizopora paradoxa TaxID=27342 RepID=A0A0H2REV6_9AGAM|nr:hypothetical protein SCHPADRAFT_623724 [Schizopora paradoxa]
MAPAAHRSLLFFQCFAGRLPSLVASRQSRPRHAFDIEAQDKFGVYRNCYPVSKRVCETLQILARPLSHPDQTINRAPARSTSCSFRSKRREKVCDGATSWNDGLETITLRPYNASSP